MSQGTLSLLFLPRSTLVLLFLYFLGQGLGIGPIEVSDDEDAKQKSIVLTVEKPVANINTSKGINSPI